MFEEGSIEGIVIRNLVKHEDDRGWLAEVFRDDEMEREDMPLMGYISVTYPGVARGPHEHVDQTDYFGFLGPSSFKVYLWDNRKNSPTYMNSLVVFAGEEAPKSVLVPPGVVHAYKNVGTHAGMVVNFPNRLFRGREKTEQVDEIRHEDDPDTIFRLD